MMCMYNLIDGSHIALWSLFNKNPASWLVRTKYSRKIQIVGFHCIWFNLSASPVVHIWYLRLPSGITLILTFRKRPRSRSFPKAREGNETVSECEKTRWRGWGNICKTIPFLYTPSSFSPIFSHPSPHLSIYISPLANSFARGKWKETFVIQAINCTFLSVCSVAWLPGIFNS